MMGCSGVAGYLPLPKMSQGVREGPVSCKGLASRLHSGSIEVGKDAAEMAAMAHFICRVLFW